MTDKRLILTTAASNDEARRIAEALVARHLAACVGIVPKTVSIYRWEGKVQEAEEWLLLIKSTSAAFDRLRAAIKELHSYQVPECLCFAVEDGIPEYLAWIAESVRA
jgi:periplasmic divalent cation tolerance protein